MHSRSNSHLALSGKEATEVRIYQSNPSGAKTEEEGTPTTGNVTFLLAKASRCYARQLIMLPCSSLPEDA